MASTTDRGSISVGSRDGGSTMSVVRVTADRRESW